jgi:hypothetical protein
MAPARATTTIFAGLSWFNSFRVVFLGSVGSDGLDLEDEKTDRLVVM